MKENNATDTKRRWLNIALLNFIFVALLGVVMRYKIAFSLPFIDQKYILHAHSHFAFAGWLTQALMTFMISYLTTVNPFKKYRPVLVANLVTAYGMLLSFPFQGYGLISITFSTLSIFVSYAFAAMYWKDLNSSRQNSITTCWFKAALIFNVLSSFGAFFLAYMMASKSAQSHTYLASVYYFLHFQYNGWFQFAAMGLFFHFLSQVVYNKESLIIIFWLFAISCVPAYFLSALWLPIPSIIYALVVLSAIAQTVAWIMTLRIIWKNHRRLNDYFGKIAAIILLMSAIAFSIKTLLQLGSTIPTLSKLAFGFRPIVIGYLHLVLLGFLSLFIIGYAITTQYLNNNKYITRGIYVLVTGIILNELLLMIQGIAAIGYLPIVFINELLFLAALIMLSGIIFLNYGQRNRFRNDLSEVSAL